MRSAGGSAASVVSETMTDAVGKPLGELRIRVVVGIVLMALAVVALWMGAIPLWLLAAAAAMLMLAEWSGLVATPALKRALAMAALALVLVVALPQAWGTDRATVALLGGLAILVGMAAAQASLAVGMIYVGLPVIGLLYLREIGGVALAFWALAIVWATDIGAYFAGRGIGGPLLAPRWSPKKTWAGLAGGVLAAALVGAAIAIAGWLDRACLWLGAPLAVLAQGGDLFESALKRRARVKDSGRLLPGHGGLLDRVDGAVPVLVLLAALVANGNITA